MSRDSSWKEGVVKACDGSKRKKSDKARLQIVTKLKTSSTPDCLAGTV